MWRTWTIPASVVGGIVLLWTLVASAQSSTPGMLVDPTDCSLNARGGLYQPCTDLDNGKGWLCVNPSLSGEPGACDSPTEWLATTSGGSGGAGGGGTLNTSTANVNVSNTTTETTLYTFSLPGNTLGTSECVEMLVLGLVTNDAPGVLTIRGKYGSGVATLVTNPFAATGQPFRTSWTICGDATANAQEAHLAVVSGEDAFDGGEPQVQFARATLAIDSTTAQNLVITAQWTAAAATEIVAKNYGHVLTTGIATPPIVVTTFNGRSGTVAPTVGDYSASLITTTPVGTLGSTTQQATNSELDSEKQAVDNDLTDLSGLNRCAGTAGKIPKIAGGVWTCGDDNNSGGGGGGPGLVDGDYGDWTISGTGTIATIDPNTITSAKIVDGTVVGADIADNTITSAKISGTIDAAHGGLGAGIPAANAVPLSNGTAWTFPVMPDCNTTSTKIGFDLVTGWVCNTDQVSASPTPTLAQAYTASGATPTIPLTGGLTLTGANSLANGLRICAASGCANVMGGYFNGSGDFVWEQSPVKDNVINVATAMKFDLQGNGTSFFQMSSAGVFSAQSGAIVNNSAATQVLMPQSAGTAPTADGDCRFDTTADRYVCGGLGATNTLAYLSDVAGGGTVAIANGGTGQTTAQTAINALTQVSGGTNEYVLTKDTATGNALWKVASGGGGGGGNVTADWAIQSDVSPTILSGDAANYNPTSLATSTVLKLSSDKLVSISGLAGGADGRILTLINIGSHRIVLTQENAASNQANRFSFADLNLFPNESVVLIYDTTAAAGVGRWRLFSIGALRQIMDPASRIIFEEEFNCSSGTLCSHSWSAQIGGTGSSTQSSTYGSNATEKAMGVMQSDTGSTAAAEAGMSAGSNMIVPAQGILVFQWRVAVEALSTAADEYTIYAGLEDASNSSAGDVTDGVYFQYKRTVDGDFWAYCAAGSGTRTCTASTQAVTTAYIWLMAVTDATWSTVNYYARPTGQANWTYLGQIADANIPIATELTGPGYKIEKTGGTTGTTQRNFDVDSFFMMYEVKR